MLRITVDVNVFSNVIGQISIGDTGYAMVVDAKGNIIAHPDSELIPQQMNYISLASQDGSYQAMADCVSSAIAGESGFGEVTLDGVSKYVSYAPISNAEGWSCIMVATPFEHTQSIYNSVVIGAIVAVVCFALSVLLIITIVKKIISPVKQCSDRIVTLSHGDLHQQELDFGKKIDKEISQLSESTNLISKNINEIISDIDTMLRTLGNGDLTYKPADVYLGDFAPIRQSYESIMISLNKTMDKSVLLQALSRWHLRQAVFRAVRQSRRHRSRSFRHRLPRLRKRSTVTQRERKTPLRIRLRLQSLLNRATNR